MPFAIESTLLTIAKSRRSAAISKTTESLSNNRCSRRKDEHRIIETKLGAVLTLQIICKDGLVNKDQKFP